MSYLQKACVAIILALSIRRRKKKRIWTREWLLRRDTFSHMSLLDEVRVSTPKDFQNYFRMTNACYEKLLNLVGPVIVKKNTMMRRAVSVEERLSLTLRFLATGRSFECLKFSAIIAPNTISGIVVETCEAIISTLKDYIKIPRSENEWKTIATDFGLKWNFYNALGSIDGKHIRIKKPKNSGSLYYNYKGFFSVVLMAIVNANYEFLLVDVGVNGRISDGGVIRQTDFWKLYEEKQLQIPLPSHIPQSKEKFPFVFLTDEAFPLKPNFMKPYSQATLDNRKRIFNYRLSRARRVVENAFGILVSRFRVFQTEINLEPTKVNIITMACCYLHNYLLKENRGHYIHDALDTQNITTGQIEKGDKRANCDLTVLQRGHYLNSSVEAKEIRDRYCNYFNNEGSVPWQNDVIKNQ